MESCWFLRLPAEIRNHIYLLLLLRETRIDPWHKGHNLATNLLRTNKTIHREAVSVLYGFNRFYLRRLWCDPYPGPDEFLDQIGPHNARHIRDIQIELFRLCNVGRNSSRAGASSEMFAKIQSDCSSLKTLVVSPVSFGRLERMSFDSETAAVAEIIAAFDAGARAIASLEEIIVNFPLRYPAPFLRKEMESHGWKIKELKP